MCRQFHWKSSKNRLYCSYEKRGWRTHIGVDAGWAVQNDGTVLDKDKKQIGQIKDGTVTGGNNETIGYAKGVPVKWAAVYYFFLF